MDAPPSLDILDLYKTTHEKKIKRQETFNQILKRIHSKIEKAAKYETFELTYHVPAFLPGYPHYDIKYCIAYVISCLRKNGLTAHYQPPDMILIKWDLSNVRLSSVERRQVELWHNTAASVSPETMLPTTALPATELPATAAGRDLNSLFRKAPTITPKTKSSGKFILDI